MVAIGVALPSSYTETVFTAVFAAVSQPILAQLPVIAVEEANTRNFKLVILRSSALPAVNKTPSASTLPAPFTTLVEAGGVVRATVSCDPAIVMVLPVKVFGTILEALTNSELSTYFT